jgi:hypothetical protein
MGFKQRNDKIRFNFEIHLLLCEEWSERNNNRIKNQASELYTRQEKNSDMNWNRKVEVRELAIIGELLRHTLNNCLIDGYSKEKRKMNYSYLQKKQWGGFWCHLLKWQRERNLKRKFRQKITLLLFLVDYNAKNTKHQSVMSNYQSKMQGKT